MRRYHCWWSLQEREGALAPLSTALPPPQAWPCHLWPGLQQSPDRSASPFSLALSVPARLCWSLEPSFESASLSTSSPGLKPSVVLSFPETRPEPSLGPVGPAGTGRPGPSRSHTSPYPARGDPPQGAAACPSRAFFPTFWACSFFPMKRF